MQTVRGHPCPPASRPRCLCMDRVFATRPEQTSSHCQPGQDNAWATLTLFPRVLIQNLNNNMSFARGHRPTLQAPLGSVFKASTSLYRKRSLFCKCTSHLLSAAICLTAPSQNVSYQCQVITCITKLGIACAQRQRQIPCKQYSTSLRIRNRVNRNPSWNLPQFLYYK